MRRLFFLLIAEDVSYAGAGGIIDRDTNICPSYTPALGVVPAAATDAVG